MKIKRNMVLYFRYASMCLKSVMQYKVSFLLMIAGRFLLAFNEFVAIKFLFSNLINIKGYSYGDMLLCFSIMQMSFTFAELFGNGFQVFSGTVKRGEFDRMLVRPISPILQVMGNKFEIGRTGPMITAVVTLVIGIKNSQAEWGVMAYFTLALMVTGGTVLFVGLFMLGAISLLKIHRLSMSLLTGQNPTGSILLIFTGKESWVFVLILFRIRWSNIIRYSTCLEKQTDGAWPFTRWG